MSLFVGIVDVHPIVKCDITAAYIVALKKAIHRDGRDQ